MPLGMGFKMSSIMKTLTITKIIKASEHVSSRNQTIWNYRKKAPKTLKVTTLGGRYL